MRQEQRCPSVASLDYLEAIPKYLSCGIKQREDSPLGNCEEANLINKMLAPAIKARRMPPIAADPATATGPSEDISNKEVTIKERTSALCVRLSTPNVRGPPSANGSLQIKSSLLPVFVNKVVREHGYVLKKRKEKKNPKCLPRKGGLNILYFY